MHQVLDGFQQPQFNSNSNLVMQYGCDKKIRSGSPSNITHLYKKGYNQNQQKKPLAAQVSNEPNCIKHNHV